MIFAVLLIGALIAQPTYAQYWDRGEPKLGSRIATVGTRSPWPLDRNFSEFSSEEQRRYKTAHYEGMPDDETPPFPINGLGVVAQEIRDTARGRVLSWPRGRVFAVVTVSESGHAKKVEVYESPSVDITKITSYVLMNSTFSPAECAGAACQGEFLWEVNYYTP
ncbi:hypothetical protein GCM10007053_15840 [Halioglobus pacificus]|uniref:TonB C-terminal domain-containing protein n=1 Tax=Parahalioglobus pacificus TaxID=930806 RepID=A0A918XH41_9GAMM|nr:hypothetical protein GCM10007053_15840 [Halioglobus pacificus]